MFDLFFHAPITSNFSLITLLLNVNNAVSTALPAHEEQNDPVSIIICNTVENPSSLHEKKSSRIVGVKNIQIKTHLYPLNDWWYQHKRSPHIAAEAVRPSCTSLFPSQSIAIRTYYHAAPPYHNESSCCRNILLNAVSVCSTSYSSQLPAYQRRHRSPFYLVEKPI